MPGPLGRVLRQDLLPRAERGGQGCDPGQAQRAQAARGQGGGERGHQPAPAPGRQHEEAGEDAHYSIKSVRISTASIISR